MAEFRGATPQYVAIARALKSRVEALAPGTRLPSQRALSCEFDVTLMTLREAIRLLEREGLVHSRHGAGTYVAPRHVSLGLGDLRSLAAELSAQGLALETRVLAQGRVRSAKAARRLRAPERSTYRIDRLRLVAGRPIALQRSSLPLALGRRLAGADLSERSLYDTLRELGARVARAEETLRAIALPQQEAALLEDEEGAPALLSERLTLSDDEQPLLCDEAYLPGSRVAVAAERLARDAGVRYALRLAEGGRMS